MQTAITTTSPPVAHPHRLRRWVVRLLFVSGIGTVIGWFCWPGQVSYFTVWLIRPGMSTARVEWLLGSPGTVLTEEKLPDRIRKSFAVAGGKFVRWDADPHGSWYVDFVIASVENGVVQEIHAWEFPLAGTPPNEPFR